MKKKIAILIIVLALIAAAAVVVYTLVKNNRPVKDADKIYVQSVRSLQSYGGYKNRYSGIVEPQKSEKTEFDTERKPGELFVKIGDLVKEGDPLFSYDTESISLEIDQINLEIEKTNTDITNNTARIDQLTRDMAMVSEADRLEYSAEIAQLQADIAQERYDVRTKESEIKKKQASIDNSTVTAKMGGIVTDITDVNDILNGVLIDDSGNPSTVYITVTAEGTFRIKGKISENNIFEISVGEGILIRSRVDDNATWNGVISSIDTQSTANSQNEYYSSSADTASKYDFYVEPETTEGLIIGQHVTLEPYTGDNPTSEGIWLDGSWILEDENGETFVWATAQDGGKLEKRAVKKGRIYEETGQVEIVSGLALTDFVAWPDESCYAGAPTTSEIVVTESEPGASEQTEGPMPAEQEAIIMDTMEAPTFE